MHFNLITVYQGGLGGPLTQLHSLDQEFSFQLHYDYILAVHCVAAFNVYAFEIGPDMFLKIL